MVHVHQVTTHEAPKLPAVKQDPKHRVYLHGLVVDSTDDDADFVEGRPDQAPGS